jgi:capsular polysaccharide biosynthesis protein
MSYNLRIKIDINWRNVQMDNDTFEIDLRQLLQVAVARMRLIVLIVFVFAVSAFLISKYLLTPMYTSTATLYVNSNKTAVSQNITINDIDTGRELVSLYTQFIESDTVLEQVAEEVSAQTDIAVSAAEIRGMISSSAVSDTALMAVTATTADPNFSQIVANAVAKVAPDRITEFMEGSSVKVVDEAKTGTLSSPNVAKNTAMGFLAGVVISLGLVFVMELMDTRIKNEDDLKRMFDYPVIGVIPEIIVDEAVPEKTE